MHTSSMIQKNVDLRPYNTFGVSAKAKYFVDVKTPDQFAKLLSDPIFDREEKLFLGGGSNMLLTKDVNGLVIRNSIDSMRLISLKDDKIKIMVGGGVQWHDFVMWAVERGRWGVENLALIPGTVGAAPVQNIGAYGVEVSDVIKTVKGFDMTTKDIRALNPIECHFGYRESVFKQELKGRFFITHITFELSKIPSPMLSYRGLDELDGVEDLTPLQVAEKVIAIRESKLPDWKKLGTAGSFFRNPIVPSWKYDELKEKYENLVGREIEDDIKLSAGQLIELAGFPRGTRVGDAGNYDGHALVLVNHGDATGAEVWSFAEQVMAGVEKEFGVKIMPEVNIL